MSLTTESMTPADIGAVVGNNGNNGWGGDGAFWIIVLFLLAMGGWGNGFGNNGSQGEVQRGFDQSAVMSGINGISTGICNGFAGVEAGASGRQIANMQQLFNAQTDIGNRLDSIQMGQQNCCCENRAQTADLKYTVAQEAAASRAATADGTQAILDKLCSMEIDGLKERNAQLVADNSALRFAQSQTAQNGFFQNALNNAVQQIRPTPDPAYIVPNPYAAYGNYGCGCGFNG